MQSHFAWNCTAQHAMRLNKFWIKKDTKECSFGIQSIQIGITEAAPIRTDWSDQFSHSLFANNTAAVKVENDSDDKIELSDDVSEEKTSSEEEEEEDAESDEEIVKKTNGNDAHKS